MKKQFIFKQCMLLLSFCSGLILYSCKDNSTLDFSDSWIEYHQYLNAQDGNGKRITVDTIWVSLNTSFMVRIKTQSNDSSEPIILKQIDNNELIDVTNNQLEVGLESNYREDRGYRQINKIHVNLNGNFYSVGQIIKYKTIIGSLNGNVEAELCIKVK